MMYWNWIYCIGGCCRKRIKEEGRATGLEVVAGNDDLLTEILLRLPVNSLLRFKSVSRHWLSLISNLQFCALKSKRSCKHISGLLLNNNSEYTFEFEFVPLENDCPAPFKSLYSVVSGLDVTHIIQYCNGLLLCQKNNRWSTEAKCYIINPTTKQHTAVSVSVFAGKDLLLSSVALAFDPRISPHFKLICLYWLTYKADYCVRIYSSETGLMSQLSDVFHKSTHFLSYFGIYWNGAISWLDNCETDSLYFNVDDERFGVLPMPPAPQDEDDREICYYGESNDHLYLVQTDPKPATQLDVYEMDRECSGWVLRFHVDLRPMFRVFPTISKCEREEFGILAIVDKDGRDNSFIVFCLPGKAIIRFNLKDRIFTKICDFSSVNDVRDFPLPIRHRSIQFIESLHPL